MDLPLRPTLPSSRDLANSSTQRVEETVFQTVEALATFIAQIATTQFGNERVTVKVDKPSAMAFVERSGVEVTRSLAFFGYS